MVTQLWWEAGGTGVFRRTLWPLIYTKQMKTGAERLFWEFFEKNVKVSHSSLTNQKEWDQLIRVSVNTHERLSLWGNPMGGVIASWLITATQRSVGGQFSVPHRIPAMLLPALQRDHEARLYQCSQGGHGAREAQEDQEDRQVQLDPDHPGERKQKWYTNLKDNFIMNKLQLSARESKIILLTPWLMGLFAQLVAAKNVTVF